MYSRAATGGPSLRRVRPLPGDVHTTIPGLHRLLHPARAPALGTQATSESALRWLRAGGTPSSLGVYSGKLSVLLEPFAAGWCDHKIVTTLCPGGKEPMRRLMELVRHGRLDLFPLLTHTFSLDQILKAYELFGQERWRHQGGDPSVMAEIEYVCNSTDFWALGTPRLACGRGVREKFPAFACDGPILLRADDQDSNRRFLRCDIAVGRLSRVFVQIKSQV